MKMIDPFSVEIQTDDPMSYSKIIATRNKYIVEVNSLRCPALSLLCEQMTWANGIARLSLCAYEPRYIYCPASKTFAEVRLYESADWGLGLTDKDVR